jgi:hypothetical protein
VVKRSSHPSRQAWRDETWTGDGEVKKPAEVRPKRDNLHPKSACGVDTISSEEGAALGQEWKSSDERVLRRQRRKLVLGASERLAELPATTRSCFAWAVLMASGGEKKKIKMSS